MYYFNHKVCRVAQQCVFTNYIVRKVLYAPYLREGLKWKAHSPTKEVRGLVMESLTKGGTTNGHAIINLKIALFLAMTQNSGYPSEANRLAFCLPCKKQNSGNSSEANRLAFCLPCKKQNSGNSSGANRLAVISRSFNHQSKNEQLIRLFVTFISRKS